MFDILWLLFGIIIGFITCALVTADHDDSQRGRPV